MDKTLAIELAISYDKKRDDKRYTIKNQLQYQKQFEFIVKMFKITYKDIFNYKKRKELK